MSDSHPELFGDFSRRHLDDWERLAEPALKGRPLSTLVSRSPDGVDVQPLYTRQSGPRFADHIGLPGFFPYTRGTTAAGTTTGWDVRQSYADPDIPRLVEAMTADLKAGATSISIAAPILDVASAARILSALPEGAKVILDTAHDAFETATVMVAASEAEDRPIVGNLGADPLHILLSTGRLPIDVDASFRLVTDLAHHIRGRSGLKSVLVHGETYDDGGATDSEELAYAMATGLTYLRALIAAGFPLAEANEQIGFRLSVGPDVLNGVAKIRAARTIWSRIMGACGARDDARRASIEAVTSRRSLSRFDVWTNVLRATTSAFGAIVGGADAIVVRSHVDPVGIPDDAARRIAKNVQIILRDEAGVGRVADPAGGAWAFEELTANMAKAAWKRLQEVESQGGIERAIEAGFVTRRIEETAAATAEKVHTRRQTITGLTDFPWLDEPPPTTLATTSPPSSPPHPVKLGVDGERGRSVARAIELLREGASTTDLTAALLANESSASVRPLKPSRIGEDFEALRIAAEPASPTILLVPFGSPAERTARVGFASSFFAVAGIRAIDLGGFDTPESAADAVQTSGATLAVMCSADEVYTQHAEAYARAVKRAGVKFLYLAGRPAADADRQKRAGVDAYVHLGVDAATILRGALMLAGVLS